MIRKETPTMPQRFARTVILLLLSLSLTAQAQDPAQDSEAVERYAGRWQGAIDIPGSPLEVGVHFLFEAGRWRGTIDIPAQGAAGLPLENIALGGETFTFAIAGVPGAPTFTGTLVGESLQGDFSQSGQTFPFALERASAAVEVPIGVAVAEAFLGSWQGAIDPEGLNLAIGVTFTDSGGSMEGRYAVPAQGIEGAVLVRDAAQTTLAFVLQGVPGEATFEGELVGDTITGTFSQSGQTLPFALERAEEALSLRRPQDPLPPFPYREEEVRYPSGDITLAATLTLPEGSGPFPALLLLTGSGPQDRNEELFGHRPFLVIADALTRAGFAVLRADDRGVGASEGDFGAARFDDFVQDALAGLDYLTSHPEVDAARVGLLGHSEGGFIAPMVASASAEVAFVITLAGPSVRGAEVLELQNRLIFEIAGATEAQVEAQLAYLRELVAFIQAGDVEAAKARTRAHIEESVAELPEEERPTPEEQALVTEAQVASVEAGWFQDFLSFDPAPYLRELTVPLLAVYGERDLQVPPEQSEGPLRELMREANNEDVTVVVFDGLNHLMQPARTGATEEYGAIETTIAPEVLELLTGWLSERFGNP